MIETSSHLLRSSSTIFGNLWKCSENVQKCSSGLRNNSQFSSVMWSKLKIVIVQQINSRIWDVIDNCNLNNLAKNQVSNIFYSRAIRRSVLPKFTELCVETPCWCPSGLAQTWRPETNRNICHWVLLQRRKKTIQYYFFQWKNCSDSQISRNKFRNKSLFNQLGRHINTASRKSLDLQA